MMPSTVRKHSHDDAAQEKSSLGQRTLDIGSSFAAGAMMLSHMNRSGLTRYDDLMADLSRLHANQARDKRADRPLRPRPRWVAWIYR
ncbi:hypothetical protein C3941_16505 [Kaistia algarum]|uniref:hypothetical protein n=1 Tax=Kaistia algarum TaxID=2083279 RepID=UPI000CE857FE|nr:hypothetical protein [Kaistia algarum]MCX5514582.1 hypothetical protein [Kaistia algarum]PPE78973.1 hypothetical protein C3941_16505 [Kaistia algarum]